MFINEFFDGVCVEIPSSVISLNTELKPILEELSKDNNLGWLWRNNYIKGANL